VFGDYLFEFKTTTTLVVNYDEQLLSPLLLEGYKVFIPNRVDYLDEFASLVNLQDLFQ
jgi:hypothetical protein